MTIRIGRREAELLRLLVRALGVHRRDILLQLASEECWRARGRQRALAGTLLLPSATRGLSKQVGLC